MTKNRKKELIDELTNEFKSSNGLVVADYKGLSVAQIELLRDSARVENVKVRVVKNTLANIALKSAEIDGIELKDTNLIIWGDDQLTVCKVAAKYAENQNKNFEIKVGFMENEITDRSKIEALSKMPSRDELIGMLLSTWMAPITNFTIGLDALRKQKEESA